MKKIVLLCLLLIVSLFTACSPYTTQGNIIGKQITQDNRYAIQIQFVDNNGNIKNFDWYVTAETYEVYKIGDITDVNVESGMELSPLIIIVFIAAIIFGVYRQYTKKNKKEIRINVDKKPNCESCQHFISHRNMKREVGSIIGKCQVTLGDIVYGMPYYNGNTPCGDELYENKVYESNVDAIKEKTYEVKNVNGKKKPKMTIFGIKIR